MGLRCPGVGLSCFDPGVELLRPPGLRRLSPGVLRQPPHGPLLAAWRVSPKHTVGFFGGAASVFFGIARGILAG